MRSVSGCILGLLLGLTTTMASADTSEASGPIKQFRPELSDIVSPNAKIERLASGFRWSEGPLWIADNSGYLLFTDVPRNTMYKWSESGGLEVFLKPSGYAGEPTDIFREPGANGLIRARDGSVLMADHGNRAVAKLDLATKTKTLLVTRYQDKRFNSPNDLVLHKTGAIFFTDPPYGLKGLNDSPHKEQAVNGVYRYDPDGTVTLVYDGLTFPNGIGLSPDHKTLYVANSDPDRPVWMAFDVDDQGAVSNPRLFHDGSDLREAGARGLPDGMSVNAQGILFATGPGGVFVLDPQGRRLGLIDPGKPVSNCTLADDGVTLYMTVSDHIARLVLKGPPDE